MFTTPKVGVGGAGELNARPWYSDQCHIAQNQNHPPPLHLAIWQTFKQLGFFTDTPFLQLEIY